jgi:Tol biopolymer transport system component
VSHRRSIVASIAGVALAVSWAAGARAATEGPAPEIFAPGVISGPANDGAPSFTPDGKTLFFTRSGAGAGAILESHFVDGSWTTPTIAPFSGEWNDQHAAVSPTGKFLVFVTTRPVAGQSKRVANLWRVDRTADGWGTPTHLPDAVNIGPQIFKPSVAADGSIYFLSIGDNRTFALYRSRFAGGAYMPAERLPFNTDQTADVDPEIAPNQSFLLFSSSGRRPGDSHEHLYIVFNTRGTWGDVQPLRYAGDDDNGSSNDNEPDLGPGARVLYFDSDRTLPIKFPRTPQQAQEDLARINAWDNGNTNVWTLPLDQWLSGHNG